MLGVTASSVLATPATQVNSASIRKSGTLMICRALGPQAGRERSRQNCQGSRFSSALPLSGSTGTETWSCAMSQLPSIFRKHAVHRSQKLVLLPFFYVPLTRLRLRPNATSSPKVSVRSRIS